MGLMESWEGEKNWQLGNVRIHMRSIVMCQEEIVGFGNEKWAKLIDLWTL